MSEDRGDRGDLALFFAGRRPVSARQAPAKARATA